jgi:hypothetical protein
MLAMTFRMPCFCVLEFKGQILPTPNTCLPVQLVILVIITVCHAIGLSESQPNSSVLSGADVARLFSVKHPERSSPERWPVQAYP